MNALGLAPVPPTGGWTGTVPPPDQARLGQLAREQAALRRVATLVARATPPEEVFAAVAEEVGRPLPVNSGTMGRYESDGTLTFVAALGSCGRPLSGGDPGPSAGYNLGTLVFETGRPVRVDDYADSSWVRSATSFVRRYYVRRSGRRSSSRVVCGA